MGFGIRFQAVALACAAFAASARADGVSELNAEELSHFARNPGAISELTEASSPLCDSEFADWSAPVQTRAGALRCDRKRPEGYLEALIPEKFPAIASPKVLACVGVSLKHMHHPNVTTPRGRTIASDNYAACVGPSRSHFVREPAPCVSPRLVRFISGSYTEVTRCLGISALEWAPQLSHESAFHINVKSDTNAWGINQLTSIAVNEVNRALFDRALIPNRGRDAARRPYLKLAEVTGCQAVKAIEKEPMNQGKSQGRVDPCDSSAIPDNPRASLVYGGLLHLENQRQARELVSEWAHGWKARGKADAGRMRAEIAHIERELAMVIYNGGGGEIPKLFELFARSNPGRMSPTQFHAVFSRVIRQCYKRMTASCSRPDPGYRPTPRQSEVADYYDRIVERGHFLNRESGGRCPL
jgi:hypothetical protein